MTKYQVTAWCSFPHYTTFKVQARSHAEALRKARQQAPKEYAEPCDGAAMEWDDFQIHVDGDERRVRTYFEPATRITNPRRATTSNLTASRTVAPAG
jgi:hypothetical protein